MSSRDQPPNPSPGPGTLEMRSAPDGCAAGIRTPRAPRWFVWLGLIGLAGYALFLSANMAVVAAGPDSSGYLNSARLLAAGEFRTKLRVPREFGSQSEVNASHFSPLGFKLFPGSPDLVPTYPTGLPLHFAAAGKVFGWSAGPFIVQILAAVGAVWLGYSAARELGVGFALAGAGAAMLALFPVFIFTSIQTLSDTLATTWTLGALWCGLRARASRRWAAACGAAFAVAVLVRPTNLLIAPALVVLLGRDARRFALFFLGGLPGAVWLALYNHHLYGGALRSGYGNSFEAFALHYGLPTALHFAKWLAVFLPAVVLALPFAALGRRPAWRREFLALGLAVAAIMGVYLFYDVSRDVWWCLRFILPAVAALILAALLGAEALARGVGAAWPRAFRPVLALVLTVWAAAASWHWVRELHVLYVPRYERAYRDAAQVVRERLPENAIVVCSVFSGTLYYYTDLPALVYDSIAPEEFARYAALAHSGGRPIYAVIFDIEEEEVLRTRCPGAWRRLASVGNIGVWELQ